MNDHKILELEFNYIKEIAMQSTRDRYTFVQFYTGLSSAIATIFLGLLTLNNGVFTLEMRLILTLISFSMFFMGIIFLLMLIRIRQAWHESIKAINQIKEYYINSTKNNLAAAFAWSNSNLPRKEKRWNIHFYLVMLISVLNSIFFGAGLALGIQDMAIPSLMLLLASSFLVLVLLQIAFYEYALKRNV